jgi:hypothetical protein
MESHYLSRDCLGLPNFRRSVSSVILSSAALLFFGVGAHAMQLPTGTASTVNQLSESSLVRSVDCYYTRGFKICDNRSYRGRGDYRRWDSDRDDYRRGDRDRDDYRRRDRDRDDYSRESAGREFWRRRAERNRARQEGFEQGKRAEWRRRTMEPYRKAQAKKRQDDEEAYDLACRIAGAC